MTPRPLNIIIGLTLCALTACAGKPPASTAQAAPTAPTTAAAPAAKAQATHVTYTYKTGSRIAVPVTGNQSSGSHVDGTLQTVSQSDLSDSGYPDLSAALKSQIPSMH